MSGDMLHESLIQINSPLQLPYLCLYQATLSLTLHVYILILTTVELISFVHFGS